MRMAQKRDMEDALWHVGNMVGTFSDQEYQNYFTNAGYASVKK